MTCFSRRRGLLYRSECSPSGDDSAGSTRLQSLFCAEVELAVSTLVFASASLKVTTSLSAPHVCDKIVYCGMSSSSTSSESLSSDPSVISSRRIVGESHVREGIL